MSKAKKDVNTAEQENPNEAEITAFLKDYQAVALKHKLDFAINYDLTADGAVKAKFVIVRKNDEEEREEKTS